MPAWLTLLCAYLLVWVPLNGAVLVSGSLSGIGYRGAFGLAELALHGGGAFLCAAAGWMLWVRNAAGLRLAIAALAVNALLTVQAVHVSALPRDVRPGLALPLSVLAVAHASAWIAYLWRSRRVRAWLGE